MGVAYIDFYHSLSNQMQMTCINSSQNVSSVTLGSPISLDVFHHVFISIKFISKERLYQVIY